MKIPRFRWWIVVLVLLAAVLNYVDRQTLSALAPTIQQDLRMDDRAYANIVNLFLVAYTASYLLAGRFIDRIGTRIGMLFFVAWWSVANMLTAAAQGVRSMGAFRFLLGLGEAGVWPAASKVVSEWFPPKERALAVGLYTMGATIGATVAPYVVIPIARFAFDKKLPALHAWLGEGTGWRVSFLLTGAAGLVWAVLWIVFYRNPRQSRYVTTEELAIIEQPEPENRRTVDTGQPWSWRQVFFSRVVWLLLLGRLITDPIWYFYQFWFPKYLHEVRGLDQAALTITWVIYAAAGVGSLGGGWLSGCLIKRGMVPVTSRLCVMSICALLMPVSMMVASASSTHAALAFACIAVIAALGFLINISALVMDLVPKHSLGTVFGVVAAGSTLGGILMNTAIARMVSGPPSGSSGFLDQGIQAFLGPLLNAISGKGYGPWFIAMACLHLLACLLLWAGGLRSTKVAACKSGSV
ncbi:MAG TPA: MFS transporter [Rariglobus sp.]|jgi:ACS family hexuronate transporter-like MFS transporter|nr:MFS transporter [Rariglobus sp.]